MSIEVELKRIADCLESLVSRFGGEVPTPAPKKEKAPAKAAAAQVTSAPAAELTGPKATKDDVTDALREAVNKKGQAKAKEILAEFGASRISELKEEFYDECLKQLNKAINE